MSRPNGGRNGPRPESGPGRFGARGPRRPYKTPTGRLRLFFAVLVPDELKAEFRAAQKNLRGNYWKPVPPDQFHVTLHFMPAVDPKVLDEVVRAGQQVAAGVPAFTATVRGTGFFPNEGSPRVWFARVDGTGFEPLAAGLAERIRLDDQEPDLEFHSHVTLARKKGPAPRPDPVVFNHSFPVTQVALVRSTLQPDGPTYETLHLLPLAAAASPEDL